MISRLFVSLLSLASLLSPTSAWTTASVGFSRPSASATTRSSTTSSPSLQAVSRQDFLQTTVAATTGLVTGAIGSGVLLGVQPALAGETVSLPNGVKYEVIKKGDGPKPEIGELVAIRFAAFAGDNKIDDIFETPEPYYTRSGSGALLKGVEETLPLMKVGDRWRLSIPSNLAFGPKGRPASAGKPRIPGDTIITFEVEMVGLPGKEKELIELIGDV